MYRICEIGDQNGWAGDRVREEMSVPFVVLFVHEHGKESGRPLYGKVVVRE